MHDHQKEWQTIPVTKLSDLKVFINTKIALQGKYKTNL